MPRKRNAKPMADELAALDRLEAQCCALRRLICNDDVLFLELHAALLAKHDHVIAEMQAVVNQIAQKIERS
jgi:hypothetical protein